MPCYQLTPIQLQSYIAQGYRVIGGPFDEMTECLADCTEELESTLISTGCCPSLPRTLCATLSGAPPCGGSFDLVYSDSANWWEGIRTTRNCTDLIFQLSCYQDPEFKTFYWRLRVIKNDLKTVVFDGVPSQDLGCDPLNLRFILDLTTCGCSAYVVFNVKLPPCP